MLTEKEEKDILKDPEKLRGFAKDLRAEADRLEAKAANPDMVGTRAACVVLACVAYAP